jgi:hypothetical protein
MLISSNSLKIWIRIKNFGFDLVLVLFMKGKPCFGKQNEAKRPNNVCLQNKANNKEMLNDFEKIIKTI